MPHFLSGKDAAAYRGGLAMNIRRLISSLAATLLTFQAFLPSRTSSAGQFETIRNEVDHDDPPPKEEKTKKKKNSSGHDHHHSDCDDDDSFLGELLGSIIGGIFEGATCRHRRRNRDIQYEYDDGETPISGNAHATEMYFAPYPYADGYVGYMVPSMVFLPEIPQTGSRRIQFEFGSDFDDIDRWAVRFLLEGTSGWGLDGDWNYYTERVSPGVQDHLHVGDVNVLFRLVETERIQGRLGIGVNWFDSGSVSDVGINGTVKVDVYPVQPIIMSGEVDYGTLGDAEMFHGMVSLGVNWRRAEIFAGYDYRKIGPVKLEGPMFGVQLWW